MPRICPDLAMNETLSRTRSPSLLRTVSPRTSILLWVSSTSVLSISSVICSPTIISVSFCSFVSFVSTVSIYLPLRKTVTRSEISITSLSLCVMIIIDLPAPRILRRTSKSLCVSCGVKTAVGSSRIRISAPRYRTLTISTVCF